jgi:hypothetical protein
MCHTFELCMWLIAFTSQTQCSMENVNISLFFCVETFGAKETQIFLSCDISFLNPTHTLTKTQ